MCTEPSNTVNFVDFQPTGLKRHSRLQRNLTLPNSRPTMLSMIESHRMNINVQLCPHFKLQWDIKFTTALSDNIYHNALLHFLLQLHLRSIHTGHQCSIHVDRLSTVELEQVATRYSQRYAILASFTCSTKNLYTKLEVYATCRSWDRSTNHFVVKRYTCGPITMNFETLRSIAPLFPYINEQELSYRKQIARQLRTQYAESIYRLVKYYTVTLKSRLRSLKVTNRTIR